MDLLTQMKDAQERPAVGLTDFLNEYTPHSVDLYCFFEGRDDVVFYSGIIRHVTKRQIHSYVCKGKEGVIRNYTTLKANLKYQQARKGFFVDTDFDKSYNNQDIYETPCYSLENLYVNLETFKTILDEVFRIERTHPDFNIATNIFERLLNEFHEKILPLNCFLYSYSLVKHTNVPELNYQNVNTNDCVSTDLSKVSFRKEIPTDLEGLKNFFDFSGIISPVTFAKSFQTLQTSDLSKSLRGKYQLQFFSSFLKVFKESVNSKKAPLLSQKYKGKLSFKIEVIMTELNSFVKVPECLYKYLERMAA